MRPALVERLRAMTRGDCLRTLLAAGVPCGSVRDIPEVLADPQLAARDMIVSMPHPTAGTIRQLGVPAKLSGTPGGVRTAPPRLGEHTDGILRELGFADERIRELRATGAV